MVKRKISYTLSALKNLLASENSCVYYIENCRRCINTSPGLAVNLKDAVKEHLSSKIGTFDAELQGIILSHKNVKVVLSVQMSDAGDYRLDYIADIYLFKPTPGNLLTGRVNKKSQDHLGVLVHSVFNATIPRTRVDDECPKIWSGGSVRIGDQVLFEVVKINFSSRPAYIKGKLIAVENENTEDGDSGIGGHESTEDELATKVSKKQKEKKVKKHDFPEETDAIEDLKSAMLNDINQLPFSSTDTGTNNELSLAVSGVLRDSKSDKLSKKEKRESFLPELSEHTQPDGVHPSTKTENTPKNKKLESSYLGLESSLIKSALDKLSISKLPEGTQPKQIDSNSVNDLSSKSKKRDSSVRSGKVPDHLRSPELLEEDQAKRTVTNKTEKSSKKKKSKTSSYMGMEDLLIRSALEQLRSPKLSEDTQPDDINFGGKSERLSKKSKHGSSLESMSDSLSSSQFSGDTQPKATESSSKSERASKKRKRESSLERVSDNLGSPQFCKDTQPVATEDSYYNTAKKAKKRKLESSLAGIENSLISKALHRLRSPELYDHN